MSLFSSPSFSSAAASGTDWRDTAKNVLEKLEGLRGAPHDYNLGFLYISDHLADDAASILALFKSVLGIEHWVGGVSLALCGNGESFIDVPAISVLVGQFDPADFHVFSGAGLETNETEEALKPWLTAHDPLLVFVHGDPMADQDPALSLKKIEQMTNGFVLGGLTSSRHAHLQFADHIERNAVSGVLFSQNVPVATMLSQGCTPISPVHTITRCHEHTIFELDSQKAAPVFEDAIRRMVIQKTDRDPNTIIVEAEAATDPSLLPDDFQFLMKGEVHAAFPISESDQNDYLVRNIVGLDPDEGALTVSEYVAKGDRILFVHRDHDSVYQDLSARLLALRARVTHDTGRFAPKAALYVSCVARAFNQFEGAQDNELALIREIIGDVPLAGFYAGGEICKARLYGYTGILTLFL